MSSSTDEGEEPKVGMTFSSEEEVTRYYENYARCIGFGVWKISLKHVDDGKKYFTLACNRSRSYVRSSKNLSKPIPTTTIQCKARINLVVSLDGKITISRVALEHSHELCPTKSVSFRCNKNLDLHMERRLELNDQAEINVSKKVRAMVDVANGNGNFTFGGNNCSNYIGKVRQLQIGIEDAEAIQKYCIRMQNNNNQFYYVMDVDDKSQLQNVFWADARCRAAYEYFGDVITFDTTYLTNNMPFVSFVGVNHHGQSVLLGCALLSNEDTKTFIWLFKTWLECMDGRSPNAIITHQDIAMKNAIEVVFPKARHRWCLWHLMKKVPEKLGRHSDYECILTFLNDAIYDSSTISDFMEKWGKMIEHFELHDNEWLKGIFDERHRWVPVYVRDTFWAGMSIIHRSERMTSFFDGYVNSKTTLKQFVEQYDYVLKDKIENESKADFDSFNTTIACISHFGFESQFQRAFTNEKFKEFQIEIASLKYCSALLERTKGLNSTFWVIESKIVYDRNQNKKFKVIFNEKDFEIQCSCCLFEFKGILCRHILSVLQLTSKTESVPSCYILSRWRKDIKRRHTLIKCGTSDHLVDIVELQRVGKACNAFYEVASTGIHTEDDLLKVMNWIEDLKIELTCKQSSHVISNKKSNNGQIQEEGLFLSRVQETENAACSTSQTIDLINTQESIQVPYYSQSQSINKS